MMEWVNLTPHNITVGDRNFPPSGSVARVSSKEVDLGPVDGVPTVSVEFGAVEGLPDPKPNTMFIVSGLVKAQTNRRDVVAPGRLVRDENGNVKGAAALIR